ncbi:MAG: 16S rRNA (guanine(966)-N(2))-methyltransferase RsmD [Candidatus Margulisiibacteriota bacterium]
MNIISGKYKRRKLLYPKQREFRPTKSIVREAVFSMIGSNIEGASFLDLCSGTGAMGLEAESRGASRVVCVDRDVRFLIQNVELLNASAQVVRSDAIRYLKTMAQPFDYVYFDPVWANQAIYDQFFELFGAGSIISNQGLLFVEYDQLLDTTCFSDLMMVKTSYYGNSIISILTI